MRASHREHGRSALHGTSPGSQAAHLRQKERTCSPHEHLQGASCDHDGDREMKHSSPREWKPAPKRETWIPLTQKICVHRMRPRASLVPQVTTLGSKGSFPNRIGDATQVPPDAPGAIMLLKAETQATPGD